MEVGICKFCIHHTLEDNEHWCFYLKHSGVKEGVVAKRCEIIPSCCNFEYRYSSNLYGHYEFDFNSNSLIAYLGEDKMRNDNFETSLRSYDQNKGSVLSAVNISCRDYTTFTKIVEAVMPILEKEDIKKECE